MVDDRPFFHTPLKFNGWNLRITHLERKIHLPNLHFQVPCQSFQGVYLNILGIPWKSKTKHGMFFRMIHINKKPRCQWECIIPLLGLDLPIKSGDLQLQEVCASWSLKNFQSRFRRMSLSWRIIPVTIRAQNLHF